MKKLDTYEMQVLNHTLEKQIEHVKSLLLDIKNDRIDLAYVQKLIDMNKKEILEIHKQKYKFWHGKNGNWNTYLPYQKKISSHHMGGWYLK